MCLGPENDVSETAWFLRICSIWATQAVLRRKCADSCGEKSESPALQKFVPFVLISFPCLGVLFPHFLNWLSTDRSKFPCSQSGPTVRKVSPLELGLCRLKGHVVRSQHIEISRRWKIFSVVMESYLDSTSWEQ